MKRLLLLPLMGVAGVAVGGAAGYAVTIIHPAERGAKSVGRPSSEAAEPPEFVPTDLLVPLVFGDGQLAGYASLQLQLRVTPGTGELVKARLPLLLNAVNLQTYRTPLATGTDGRLPDLTRLRELVQRSADQALGRNTVLQVAITEAHTS